MSLPICSLDAVLEQMSNVKLAFLQIKLYVKDVHILQINIYMCLVMYFDELILVQKVAHVVTSCQ